MKRTLYLPGLLLTMMSVLLGGCQSTVAPASTPATTPERTAAIAPATESTTTPPRGFRAESFQHIIDTLCDPVMEGRDAGTRGIELARDYLVKRFKEAGLEPAFIVDGEPSYTQPLTLKIRPGGEGEPVETTIQNVGGLLPGRGELADEVIIVGAHYDHIGYGHYGSRDPDGHGHIHPGADDNASGTAGVVLLADRFARDARRGLDYPRDRRTILFTGFAGEERGLVGSRYMTEHQGQWAFNPRKVSGMINMDMIGRMRGGELYVFSHKSGQQWRGWVETANGPVGLDAKLDVRAPGGSDHMAFIRVGIPAVFFNTWLHEDLHKPSDTPDKINARGGIRVLALVGSVLERATTHVSRVRFVPAPPKPRVGANLGKHEQGVLIRGLVDDGPLQKAGFKKGDIITSFNGKPTKTRRDLVDLLHETKPGDEVPIGFIREGETMPEQTVIIGKR